MPRPGRGRRPPARQSGPAPVPGQRSHRPAGRSPPGRRSSRWHRGGRSSRGPAGPGGASPACGGTGGSGSIAARSASTRSDRARPDRADHPRGSPAASQSVNWALKSAGEVNCAAGHERGLEEPVAPLHDAFRLRVPGPQLHDPGRQRPGERRHPVRQLAARGRSRTRCPRSAAAAPAPAAWISSHDPSSRSSVLRVGIIRPVMNRECAAVITSTGSSAVLPSSSGIRAGGNHRSHCAASPGSQVSRSAGSGRRCSGRSRRTLSRNHVIDPSQPTRSASTVAGISGCSSSSARTRASNGENDVSRRPALILRRHIRRHRPRHRRPADTQLAGRPAAAEPHPPPAAGSAPNPPQRSPTQSVWVASFSSVAMASFSSVADTWASMPSTSRATTCCTTCASPEKVT